MSEHYKSFSAVFPLIVEGEGRNGRILLHRRKNTGYHDGKWDLAGGGHVEQGETAQSAVIRECKEELGISVRRDELAFAHLSHRILDNSAYYDIYFVISSYEGTPGIMEPNKCSELKWFEINKLPLDLIECRRQDILNFIENKPYSEKFESNNISIFY